MSLFSLVHKNSGSSIYSAGKAYFLCHIGCRLFRRIRRERKNSVHVFLSGKLQNFVLVSGADQKALISFSSPRCIRKIIGQKDGVPTHVLFVLPEAAGNRLPGSGSSCGFGVPFCGDRVALWQGGSVVRYDGYSACSQKLTILYS